MEINERVTCKGGKSFVILKELGSGGQGSVWLVKDTDTDMKYAFKIINESDDARKRRKMANLRNLFRRWELLRPSLQQKNFSVAAPIWLYEKGGDFGYVMDLCVGESINRMMLDGQFCDMSTKNRLAMVRKIAEAADWLNNNGLSYQDFSHKNIMYDEARSAVALIDCDNISPSGQAVTGATAFAGGTGFYAAPEIAFRECNPSLESDRFALAVLFFKIMTGSTDSPYHGKNMYTRCCRPTDMFEAAMLTKEEPDFGTDWMTFVFDPRNDVNRLDPTLYRSPEYRKKQEMILKSWSRVPDTMKTLFCRAFAAPLDPAARKNRPRPSEWIRVAQGEGPQKPIAPEKQSGAGKQGESGPRPTTVVPNPPRPRDPGVTFLPSGRTAKLNCPLVLEMETGGQGVARRMGTVEKTADGYMFRSESPYKIKYYCAGTEGGGLSKGETVLLKDGTELFWLARPSERVKVSLP